MGEVWRWNDEGGNASSFVFAVVCVWYIGVAGCKGTRSVEEKLNCNVVLCNNSNANVLWCATCVLQLF